MVYLEHPVLVCLWPDDTEVRLINFNLTAKRRFRLTKLSNTLTNCLQILIHGMTTQMGQYCYLSRGQIQAKSFKSCLNIASENREW